MVPRKSGRSEQVNIYLAIFLNLVLLASVPAAIIYIATRKW